MADLCKPGSSILKYSRNCLFFRKLLNNIIFYTMVLFVVGCSSNAGVKERAGSTVGAIVGQFVGAVSGNNNRATKMIVGSVVGSMIGRRIGKSMDIRDRNKLNQTLEHNRSYHPTAWTNQNSGIHYRVTPTRTYRSSTNNPCREYETVAVRRSKRYIVRSRACRTRFGHWRDMQGHGNG